MTTTTTSSNDEAQQRKQGRVVLPSYAVPTKYELHITPNMNTFTFSGVVTITMTTRDVFGPDDTPNKLQLHAKELSFRSAKYTVVGSENAPAVPADEVRFLFCFL